MLVKIIAPRGMIVKRADYNARGYDLYNSKIREIYVDLSTDQTRILEHSFLFGQTLVRFKTPEIKTEVSNNLATAIQSGSNLFIISDTEDKAIIDSIVVDANRLKTLEP